MTPGLINSVLNERPQPPTRATIQIALLPAEDDPARRIAELERQVRESELAYDQLADKYAEIEACNRRMAHTITALEHRIQLYQHVMIYATPGVMRGVR